MSKSICKEISKNLHRKYGQELLDHAKHSATDTFKTGSKTAIQKIAETTGNLIGNKIADKTTKVSRNSLQNNPETVECETENMGFETKIPKETCISP